MKTPEEMAEEYAELMSFDVRGHQRGFLAGYQAAKDEINSSNNSNGWISVKERLPEHFEDVLTFEDGESYRVNSISELTKYWWDSDEGFERNPSHWMPLPEPPKEEK